MNISFTKDLIKKASYPSITVTFKTHRTAPGVSQDPIVLKNLRTELKSRLENELDKKEAQVWMDRFDKFSGLVDHQNNLDGMGIFLGEHVGMIKRFPFSLPNRVVVDKNFATRDLLVNIHKSLRYYVVVLSKETVDVFEANEDRFGDLAEIDGFPMENPRTHADSLEKSFSDTEDRYTEEFFREVDQQLGALMKVDALPVVLVGVRRVRDYFTKKTQWGNNIIAELDGSRDAGNASKWLGDIWKEVGNNLRAQKSKRIEQALSEAKPEQITTLISDAYKLAEQGRIQHLLVNENLHQAARFNEGNIELLDRPEQSGDYDDIIDEIAERTILNGGQVDFFSDETVKVESPFTAILRY